MILILISAFLLRFYCGGRASTGPQGWYHHRYPHVLLARCGQRSWLLLAFRFSGSSGRDADHAAGCGPLSHPTCCRSRAHACSVPADAAPNHDCGELHSNLSGQLWSWRSRASCMLLVSVLASSLHALRRCVRCSLSGCCSTVSESAWSTSE